MVKLFRYSGVGKSALVNEIHKLIIEKRGIFIEGKFDQFQRNIPYFAWLQAFVGFVNQLLTENQDTMAAWKNKIQNAVSDNGKVLTDIIPNLELVIGRQADVAELGALEAQYRFNYVLKNFVAAIAQEEHPLVIFIDDLQWADMASLNLLKALMTDCDMHYILFIGVYRDNEVDHTHPLAIMLNEIRKENVAVSALTLKNLSPEDVNALISDTLHAEKLNTAGLTSLVYTKTQGNAFFVIQFLRSLYENNLLKFDKGAWQWDIEKTILMDITDNVVELMAGKIRKLPAAAQDILKLAACVGNRLDWGIMAIVAGKSERELIDILEKALAEGLIVLLPSGAKFAHDRIQQAVYSLFDEEEKKRAHLRIGKLLLEQLPEDKREEKIFDIVNQWNFAIDIIEKQAEKIRLAELNLIAGRRAKASAAYKPSLSYLLTGTVLLPASAWQNFYDLALPLYAEAAEVAYLCGDFAATERLAREVLENARNVLDKVSVYIALSQVCWAEHRQFDGIKILLPLLEELGISLPENPTMADIQSAHKETESTLVGKQIEDLVDLPVMTDPYQLAAIEILSTVRPLAYQSFPPLYPIINQALVKLSVQYGNAPLSAYGYTGYALFLLDAVGDIDSSYRFGSLALNVLSRLNAKEVKAKVFFMFNGYVRHYKEHLRETLQPLQEGCSAGMENGDMGYAALTAYAYCAYSFFAGTKLSELERAMATYSDLIRKIKQESSLAYLEVHRQTVLNLMGQSKDPRRLSGNAYNEDTMLPALEKTKDRMGLYKFYFTKSLCEYLFHDFKQAVKNIETAHQYLVGVTGMLFVPLFHFYDSLMHLAISPDAQTLKRVAVNQKKLRLWADHAPVNYLHKFYLVEAEKYRVLGNGTKAADFYDQAIALVQDNEYPNEEALAYELAARFYLTNGQTVSARAYMQEAHYCYRKWGAVAKVKQLEGKILPIFN